MTAQEILNGTGSKTQKMRMLFEIGLTRRQVAEMLGVGYGFVQNVYANTYPDRIRGRRATQIIATVNYDPSNFVFNSKFGVEIEAFGVTTSNLLTSLRAAGISVQDTGYSHRTREYWKIVTDSSIAGTNPFELVSPILQGLEGLVELAKVCRALHGCNAKVNKSCGMHIHFDASGFDFETWKRLLKNYADLELEIDSFMPNSRRANNAYYCASMRKQNYRAKINLAREADGIAMSLNNLKTALGLSDRYYKVNLQAYWDHKTIEFRQHAGTVSYEKISNWVLFLARLIDFSKANEFESNDPNKLQKFLTEDIISFYQSRKQRLAS